MTAFEFQVIPVIDVRHGCAVRAVAGDRENYRPLVTPLAPGTSDPAAIAQGYRRLHAFDTLYVADLDGIEGRGADLAMQARVAAAWAGREVWIDDGTGEPPASQGCTRIVMVRGSESASEGSAVGDFETGILSLDFRGETFLGPRSLLETPVLWPRRIIVMTLARVGAGAGPDIARLSEIIGRAGPDREVYAAGGVRDGADLDVLASIGAAGVLVASALHGGQIKTGDLLRSRR